MKCGGVAGWDGTREQDSTAVPLTKLSSLKKGRPSPPSHPPPSARLHPPCHLQLTVLTVPFPFSLYFSLSGFHFCVHTLVRGYRCLEGRNLSAFRLGSRQLLGDEGGWIGKFEDFVEHLDVAGRGAGGSVHEFVLS